MKKFIVHLADSHKTVSVTYNYVWEDVEVEADNVNDANEIVMRKVVDGEVSYIVEEANGRDNEEADYELNRDPPYPPLDHVEEVVEE